MTALASDQFALLKTSETPAAIGATMSESKAIAKMKNAIGTTTRFASSEPPPVNTMPLSTMSAASSGGVASKATFTASTIWLVGSAKASATWRWVMTCEHPHHAWQQ